MKQDNMLLANQVIKKNDEISIILRAGNASTY
jgi:hypothetical protein